MIEIKVDATALGVTLDQLTAILADKETLHLSAAAAVELAWREHLEARYLPKDKNGVDYWADVANSLESTATDGSGTVRVHQDFIELYYYGGTTTPGKSISSWTGRPTRALAIPSDRVPALDGRRLAPGRYRSEIAPLAFVRAIEGNVIGYLFEGMETGKISRGKNKGQPRIVRAGPLAYTLKTSETYRPDPGIIPDEAEMLRVASGAMLDLITAGL